MTAGLGDLGGGKQQAAEGLPEVPAFPVNDQGIPSNNPSAGRDNGSITADGEPVSPTLAARRYGAAAGQGYAGDGDPGSP